MSQTNIDYVPVTGGMDASKYRRSGFAAPSADSNGSDLDLHIARLFALHPQLKTAFHNQDLVRLDHPTKLALLHDINVVLGVNALSNDTQ